MRRALEEMRICAADRLCAEHEPDVEDGSDLHRAVCPSCFVTPETSCELGNRWLDRTFLVETFSRHKVEYFVS
jgi:hypothetical protein